MFQPKCIFAGRQSTNGLTNVLRWISINHSATQTTPASAIVQPTKEPNKKEKLIKVAVVGVPNAGKSTFINNLINHRVY